MGLAPGQPPPSGQYIYPYTGTGSQSVRHTQSDWTTATLQSTMKTPVISSYTNAQTTHQANVAQPITDNANQIGSGGLTLTNHENRIITLENTNQVSIFYTSSTWTKPAGFTNHQVILIGGSGGGQRGQTTGSLYGGQGGGQGGWYQQTYADAALTASPYTVSIGLGGSGGGDYLSDNFNRSSLGGNWRTDSGTATTQILNNAAEARTMSSNSGENGCWNTYTGTAYLTDNVIVTASLITPTLPIATNNYTGIFVASPVTFSGSTKIVAFVASTGSGCKIITQVNAVSAPYIASGSQTGQATVATTSTNVSAGDSIALSRVGNVFTAYKNGTSIMTWTDSSNTVPTGATNRYFGIITEGNYPIFQHQYDSLAIDTITVADLDATPGTASTFSGGAISISAGGGAAGATYNAGSPAARGSGNITTTNAGGGSGGDGVTFTNGTSGGAGVGTTGGAPGPNPGYLGADGSALPTGSYGTGAGAGGGAGSTLVAGKGGSGGYPGGGAGGGGGSASNPGGGGNGANGIVWVISSH